MNSLLAGTSLVFCQKIGLCSVSVLFGFCSCLAVRGSPTISNCCLEERCGRVSQQTCLLCDTAHRSAVSHSRHVCCVTQQLCLLRYTAGMSAVSHSRHLCLSESRHICCVAQQLCQLCRTAGMCRIIPKSDLMCSCQCWKADLRIRHTYMYIYTMHIYTYI